MFCCCFFWKKPSLSNAMETISDFFDAINASYKKNIHNDYLKIFMSERNFFTSLEIDNNLTKLKEFFLGKKTANGKTTPPTYFSRRGATKKNLIDKLETQIRSLTDGDNDLDDTNFLSLLDFAYKLKYPDNKFSRRAYADTLLAECKYTSDDQTQILIKNFIGIPTREKFQHAIRTKQRIFPETKLLESYVNYFFNAELADKQSMRDFIERLNQILSCITEAKGDINVISSKMLKFMSSNNKDDEEKYRDFLGNIFFKDLESFCPPETKFKVKSFSNAIIDAVSPATTDTPPAKNTTKNGEYVSFKFPKRLEGLDGLGGAPIAVDLNYTPYSYKPLRS